MKSIIALNNQTIADLCIIATGGLNYLPEFCRINGVTADETPVIGKAYYYDYIEDSTVVAALAQSTQQPATADTPVTPVFPIEHLYAAGNGINISNTNIISANVDGESIIFNEHGKLKAVADTSATEAACKAYTDAAKSECKQYTDTAESACKSYTDAAKSECKQYTDTAIPAGVILLWSGAIADIPTGWALCDGQNNTPDLRDRFIVGAGTTYAVDDTGGSASVTLTENQMPTHTHTRGTMEITGSATQFIKGIAIKSNNMTGALSGAYDTSSVSFTSAFQTISQTTPALTLSFKASRGWTGATSEVGGGQSHENRPPYYALAYIMKL